MKKYIDDNRDLFDDKEPSAGHFERFEAMLDQQQEVKKPARRFRMISIISVAASLAVLIAIGVKFYAPNSIDVVPGVETTISTDEFQATNEYYNQQMEEQIADIMCKLANTDPQNQAQLTSDLEKILKNNEKFVKEMETNENQEVAIRFLVKHYKSNIQALENINDKLGKHTHC